MKILIAILGLFALSALSVQAKKDEKRIVCGGACIVAGIGAVAGAVSVADTVVGWFGKREEDKRFISFGGGFQFGFGKRDDLHALAEEKRIACGGACIGGAIAAVGGIVSVADTVKGWFGKRDAEMEKRFFSIGGGFNIGFGKRDVSKRFISFGGGFQFGFGKRDVASDVADKMISLYKEFGVDQAEKALGLAAEQFAGKNLDAINGAISKLLGDDGLAAKASQFGSKAVELIHGIYEKVEAALPQLKEHLEEQMAGAVEFAEKAVNGA